jgi:hypothetical protein
MAVRIFNCMTLVLGNQKPRNHASACTFYARGCWYGSTINTEIMSLMALHVEDENKGREWSHKHA